jgi:hypothetical protein
VTACSQLAVKWIGRRRGKKRRSGENREKRLLKFSSHASPYSCGLKVLYARLRTNACARVRAPAHTRIKGGEACASACASACARDLMTSPLAIVYF